MTISFRLTDKSKALTFCFRKYTSEDHPSGFTAIYEFENEKRQFDRLFFSKQINDIKTPWLNIDITSFSNENFLQSWQRELAILYKVFFNNTDIIVNCCNTFCMNSISLGIFKKPERQPIICEQHEEFLDKYTGWYVLKSDNCPIETIRHLEKELQQKHIYHCHYCSEYGELYLFLRKITVSTFLLALNRINYLKTLEENAQQHLKRQSDWYFNNTQINVPI